MRLGLGLSLSMSAIVAAPSIVPPVTDGLEGFFLFGVDAAESAKNWAPGKADASVVGSPTYGDDYAVLTGNGVAYLQTQVDHTEDMTFIAVARPLSDAAASLISNYQSPATLHAGNTNGSVLSFSTGVGADGKVVANFGSAYNNAGTSTQVTAAQANPGGDINADYAISGRVENATRGRTVNNLTMGTVNSNTPGSVTVADIGGKLRIGTSYNSQLGAQVRIYASILFSRRLSDEELTTHYDWLKAYFSGLSL
ncbi:hypothetical protein FHS85_002932 [Rhodoligotrophos appendicifer]|uniref:hypothetical protein n=1 Tax=Rhodoligotrophos appendicifer TaxID=987056 RepID=UPI0011861406|nr:hypothetical protein [Rhodoligotrophos appendicifer]